MTKLVSAMEVIKKYFYLFLFDLKRINQEENINRDDDYLFRDLTEEEKQKLEDLYWWSIK
jgi:hypothetical protein